MILHLNQNKQIIFQERQEKEMSVLKKKEEEKKIESAKINRIN